MRMPNDKRLAETVSTLDLILGGHDHHYAVTTVNGTPVVKSGTDFRDFSEITVTMFKDQPCAFEFTRHTVTRDFEQVHAKKCMYMYCTYNYSAITLLLQYNVHVIHEVNTCTLGIQCHVVAESVIL